MSVLLHLTEHLVTLAASSPLADLPDVGEPIQPPGFTKIEDLLAWAKYLCYALLIGSLMFAGVRLAKSRRHEDDGGEQSSDQVGKVLIGVMVVSAAGTLVSFLA